MAIKCVSKSLLSAGTSLSRTYRAAKLPNEEKGAQTPAAQGEGRAKNRTKS